MIDWIPIEDDDCLEIGQMVLTIGKDEDGNFLTPVPTRFTELPDGRVGYRVAVSFGGARQAGFWIETFPTHYAIINNPEQQEEVKASVDEVTVSRLDKAYREHLSRENDTADKNCRLPEYMSKEDWVNSLSNAELLSEVLGIEVY